MITRFRAEKYRFDRVGNVVADTRLTDEAGRPLPRRSSDARLLFKSVRLERRAEARNPGARAMRAVHKAAKPKVAVGPANLDTQITAADVDAWLRGQA